MLRLGWLTCALLACFAARASLVETTAPVCESELAGVRFHNSEIRGLLEGGLDKKKLSDLILLLIEKGTFDIPVPPSGFIAAANVGEHAGNYGRFIWFRDMARIYKGLSSFRKLLKELRQTEPAEKIDPVIAHVEAQARQVALAMVKLLEDRQWTEIAVKSIRDPGLHMDPVTGYREVIWVRRLIKPFEENRPPAAGETEEEQRWGHKQNDALAVFAHSLLDALRMGDLVPQDFSATAKENFILLPVYFEQLKYWLMWDVGAWEEGVNRHTSSIALATSFLERFERGYNSSLPRSGLTGEEKFFARLRHFGESGLPALIPKDVRAIVEKGLEPNALMHAVDESYRLLNFRLLGPRPIEQENVANVPARFEDAALFHVLWYPLSRLTPENKIDLIQRLHLLERPSGYIRYIGDTFLNTGAGEAEWTFFDSMISETMSGLYMNEKDERLKHEAIYHFIRAAAFITGTGEVSTENKPMPAWQIPEAYVPVKTEISGIMVKGYKVSPNSPLNWAIGEFMIAAQKIYQILE